MSKTEKSREKSNRKNSLRNNPPLPPISPKKTLKTSKNAEPEPKKENFFEFLSTSITNGDENQLRSAVDKMKTITEEKTKDALKPNEVCVIFDQLNNLPNKIGQIPKEKYEFYREITSQLYDLSKNQNDDETSKPKWSAIWTSYFQTGNNYYLELLSGIADPFVGATDETRMKYMKDLYLFLSKLKDSRTSPYNQTGDDEEKFITLSEVSINSSLNDKNSEQSLSESVCHLLKFTLENGPERKSHFYRPQRVNVFNKLCEIILKMLFQHENRTFQSSVLKPNMKSLVNVYILNNKHKCKENDECLCYKDTNDEYYSSVERFVFTQSGKHISQDVVIYVSDIIEKYKPLPLSEWVQFLVQLYPASAKTEIEKKLDTFVDLLDRTPSKNERKMKDLISLLDSIARQNINSNLFTEKQVDIIEQSCVFRDDCSLNVTNLTFKLLHEISTKNAKLFRYRGQKYYHIARQINVDCMMVVSNILKDIGLGNPTECERIVAIMEQEIVKDIDNKTFVQHVLIVWKTMAIEFVAPFKKRKQFIIDLSHDPKLNRNAKDLLATMGIESKGCSVM